MNQLPQLISPELADKLVLVAACLLSVVGLIAGWRFAGRRGAIAVLGGPLVLVLWHFHNWMTRFDPNANPPYLGLDKVKVIASEGILFVGIGMGLGWGWGRWFAPGRSPAETPGPRENIEENA